MQTNVTKWGNSYAIRFPKPFADQLGIDLSSKVSLSIDKDRLVLKKIQPDLKTLLSKISSKNIHKETDTGTALGNEIW